MADYPVARPYIHFSPQKNWINDPNGCVFFNGVYHLFFQYHPFGTQWGPMHWGHAVSTDLLNWEELEIAIPPDEKFDMIFSGSAVIDEDNVSGFFQDKPGLLAFYTGHTPEKSKDDVNVQHQCMAHSLDGGFTWIPYEKNPIIPNPGLPDFRDPKVFFHAPSKAWVMVVTIGQEIRFYRSENLRDWTKAGRFGEGYGLSEGIWECPDVFCLPHPKNLEEEVWILAVSALGKARPPHSPIQYFIGDFDGYNFSCRDSRDTVRLVDFGHDFYATQSWAALADRSVWIAWANHWAYANDIPTDGWRGMMSIPREISLAERNGSTVLKQVPVHEFENGGIDAPMPDSAPAPGVHDIRYNIQKSENLEQVLEFHYSDGGTLAVQWNSESEVLTVDRTGVSRNQFHKEFDTRPFACLSLTEDEVLDIRVVLDASLIEVFVLDGTITFTSQVFPLGSLSEIRFRNGLDGVSDIHHRVVVPESNR